MSGTQDKCEVLRRRTRRAVDSIPPKSASGPMTLHIQWTPNLGLPPFSGGSDPNGKDAKEIPGPSPSGSTGFRASFRGYQPVASEVQKGTRRRAFSSWSVWGPREEIYRTPNPD